MALRKRKNTPGTGRRRGRARAGLRMGAVFAVLIGINVYVFFFQRDTSIPSLMKTSALVRPSAAAAPRPAGEAAPARAEKVEAVEGELARGDTLFGVLERGGVDTAEAQRLVQALRAEQDLRNLRAGTRYRIERMPDGRVHDLALVLSPLETVHVVREGASFAIDRERRELQTARAAFAGVIERSLYDSIEAAAEDTSIVPAFADVFAYDLNFYVDQHPGDRFRILVDKQTLDGEFHAYGRIAAAEWDGRAGRYRAFWHEPAGGQAGYYDEQGRLLQGTLLKTPLQYVRISSRFGRRFHPILHRVKGHMGIDYAAPEGTPVRAAADGRVTFAGRQGGSGNMVVIAHAGGLTTLYMHLRRIAAGVRPGVRVRARQTIGQVGMTGLATGPHLHYGVKKDGRYLDPMRLRGAKPRPLPPAQRAAYLAAIAPIAVDLDALEPMAAARMPGRGAGAHR